MDRKAKAPDDAGATPPNLPQSGYPPEDAPKGNPSFEASCRPWPAGTKATYIWSLSLNRFDLTLFKNGRGDAREDFYANSDSTSRVKPLDSG